MPGSGAASGSARTGFVGVPLVTSLLLLTSLILNWEGYDFGGRNHSIQIPLVRTLLDPGLYPLDPIRTSFDGFATFFFHGLAAMVRSLGDLELAFFVLYFVSLAALVSGAYALGTTAFGGPGCGILTAVLFVSGFRSLAGESSHWSGLTHAEATGALLIWALALYLEGRRLTGWALVGTAFNFHGLAALYVASMLFADGVARRREGGQRELARGVPLFALLAAPALSWVVASAWTDPIRSIPDWLHVMRERSSLHAFPFSSAPAVYARYSLLLCLGWLALRGTRRGPLHRHFTPFAVAVALSCVAGVVFAEWIPVPLLIRAQLLRSTKWLTYLVMTLIAGLVTTRWSEGPSDRVAGVLTVAGVMLREPTWLAIALAVWLMRGPGVWGRAPVVASCLALAAAGATGAIRPPAGLGLEAPAVHFARLLSGPTTLVCAALFALLREAGSRLRWQRAVGATAAVVCLAWLAPGVYAKHHSSTWQDSWTRVQRWARENTPRETVFLTPPATSGFRAFSERGIVGEWKDGTQQFFSNRFATEWWRRMRDLGGRGEAYHQMGRRRLIDVGHRYGATHVVFWSGKPLVLPRVFETPDYVVYELREMTAEERSRMQQRAR